MRETFCVYLSQWWVRRDVFTWLDRFDRMSVVLDGARFPVRSAFESDARLSISAGGIPENVVAALKSDDKTLLVQTDFTSALKLEFEYEVPSGEELRRQISASDGRDVDHLALWRFAVESEVHDEVAIFNMAMDLSLPGSSFHGVYALENRGVVTVRNSKSAHINDDFDYMEEHGLAPRSDLNFETVWKTLNSTHGLREGVSNTPFGKVISAITYFYTEGGDAARFQDVKWICRGLEGFFCEEWGKRAQQVEKNASVFLGIEKTRVRSLLEDLYAVRSQFIHGNSDVSSAFVDVEPHPGEASTEEWNAKHIGAYFLVETARECIRRGIDRQGFA